jgi:hypothetical protein
LEGSYLKSKKNPKTIILNSKFLTLKNLEFGENWQAADRFK